LQTFWTHTAAELLQAFNTSDKGLTEDAAYKKLQEQKKELNVHKPWVKDLLLLLSQYKNPLVLLLVFAVILSTILS